MNNLLTTYVHLRDLPVYILEAHKQGYKTDCNADGYIYLLNVIDGQDVVVHAAWVRV